MPFRCRRGSVAPRLSAAIATACTLTAALGGCDSSTAPSAHNPPFARRALKLSPDELPLPAGRGAKFRLPAVSARVARRVPIDGLRCRAMHAHRYAIHLELYVRRLVLPVPAGIGVAIPQRRRGVYVLDGPCSYPIRSFEPTGVVVVDSRASGRPPTLGALFAVWGQPLSGGSLAGFRGRVLAFVGGRRWSARPGTIPLRRHAEIVLEISGQIPPHPAYRFPPGL